LAALPLRRPQLRIRVAGTNGKGSTATMLAAALQSAGLRVGLYTSPHLLAFNERIRINGQPVADDLLLAQLATIMPLAEQAAASYFETATALALTQFSRAAVDVEILEAGVGARFDATTALPADLALITPIGLDHQAWLGDSLAAIAAEKAYVMQGCAAAISAPQPDDAMAQLQAFAEAVQLGTRFSVCDLEDWPDLAMAGAHQQINASLSWAAVRSLATDVPTIDLARARQAIADCQLLGRLQRLDYRGASIWLDAAHNRHAVEALLPSLPALADPFDAILVFTREDRSLLDVLPLLAPYAKRVISREDGSYDSAVAALHDCLQRQNAGRYLVLGSFMTVAALLRT